MDFEYLNNFLDGEENLEKKDVDAEIVPNNEDTNLLSWGEVILESGDIKYRLEIMEYEQEDDSDLKFKYRISKKKPLKIDDGYTKWRQINKEKFSSIDYEGFEIKYTNAMNEHTPAEIEHEQKTII